MKLGILALAMMLAMSLVVTTASAGNGGGTGTCPSPNMQDADGDGIPNHLDPDYVPPRDGTGRQLGLRLTAVRGPFGWVPCVVPNQGGLRYGKATASGYGTSDGTCNPLAPKDGTGFGPGPRR